MAQEQFFKCECGSTIFRIRMDNDWDEKKIDPETKENETQCIGTIICPYCGKNFMELGK